MPLARSLDYLFLLWEIVVLAHYFYLYEHPVTLDSLKAELQHFLIASSSHLSKIELIGHKWDNYVQSNQAKIEKFERGIYPKTDATSDRR